MPRKQVLVQLDDDLVDELDALAADLDISRSELLRRAARTLLDSADEIRADLEHEAAYQRIPEDHSWSDAYAAMVAAEAAPPYETR